ncbi:hypothetical protein AB5I41_28530 [Sphingomonas sp. MMS24-JH45]
MARRSGVHRLVPHPGAGQLHDARQSALLLLAAHLVGAAIVVMMFAEALPLWQVAACATAIAGVALWVTMRRLRADDAIEDRAEARDIRRTDVDGAALALVWCGTTVSLGRYGGPASHVGLSIVLSLLMTATAIAMAPLLLAASLFIGGVAVTAAVALAMAGHHAAAAAALLFAAFLIHVAITRTRDGEPPLLQLALAERDVDRLHAAARIRGHQRRLAGRSPFWRAGS